MNSSGEIIFDIFFEITLCGEIVPIFNYSVGLFSWETKFVLIVFRDVFPREL